MQAHKNKSHREVAVAFRLRTLNVRSLREQHVSDKKKNGESAWSVRSRFGGEKKALASLQVLDFIEFNGGTCGGRTHDKRIKSPLLYQLS
jgi:hypothetical protein